MLSKKFKLAMALTLASSTLTLPVYADELASGVISVNEVVLPKSYNDSKIKGDKGLYYVYNNLLNSNVIIYDKPTYDKNSTKVDMCEMLDRDVVIFNSNFKVDNLYFPLSKVNSFICNNTGQYITFKDKSNDQHRFTLEFRNTKLYFAYRQMLLNICDTNVTKYRELNEILENFEIVDINDKGKSLADQSVMALQIDTSQLILRTRNKIKITSNQLSKTVSLERNGLDKDRYYSTLNNLKNNSYKGSRIVNIDNSNQPKIENYDYAWDWTIVPVNTNSNSIFSNEDMTNLCLRVSYNEGVNVESDNKLGSLNYVRICKGNTLLSNEDCLSANHKSGLQKLKVFNYVAYGVIALLLGKLAYSLTRMRKKDSHE